MNIRASWDNLQQVKSVGQWTRDYFYNFTANNYLIGHTSGSTEYQYDAHGNMITMPHLQTLYWDNNDWLTQVDLDAAGNKAYYVYDASGERVRKVVVKGSVREERYYFGDYEIYHKFVSDVLETERTTVNISDDKKKIATAETLTVDQSSLTIDPELVIRYQYDNHLGSAGLELDEHADIISYEEYHPFGTTSYRSGRTETETSQKRYKYVGKERDEETGLYYYGFRYYAAWICRFVSVDPLQFDYPYYTPFQYAGNKPISYIDLDGLEEAEADANEGLCTYLDKLPYKETNGINDFSYNFMSLLSNTFIVGTQNAAAGLINAVYDYKGTGKAIANSKVGQYFQLAYDIGFGHATNVAFNDIEKELDKITWDSTIDAFTSWENYELVVDILVGAKLEGMLRSTVRSTKYAKEVFEDIPVKSRLPKTKGKWIKGVKGDGIWLSEIEEVNKITKGKGIPFKNGYPDFGEWELGRIEIKGMTGKNKDFSLAYKKMMQEYGFKTQKEVTDWLKENAITLHHLEDGKTLQFVPSDLHNNIPHIGGASNLRN